MDLPVALPIAPMLAKAVAEVPAADAVEGGWSYEPKWDGFRCLVCRDGDEVELLSRAKKPLTRYFPEVVELVRSHLPARCVSRLSRSIREAAGWIRALMDSQSSFCAPGSPARTTSSVSTTHRAGRWLRTSSTTSGK